jgi:hypothetical protein
MRVTAMGKPSPSSKPFLVQVKEHYSKPYTCKVVCIKVTKAKQPTPEHERPRLELYHGWSAIQYRIDIVVHNHHIVFFFVGPDCRELFIRSTHSQSYRPVTVQFRTWEIGLQCWSTEQ